MIRRALDLLANKKDFRLLMGAQFCAQAGDGIVQAAIAKLIVFGAQRGFDVEGARDPEELLRIVLYVFVPYTIISPFIGVIIDRWNRRRLLFVANGFRALVIGLVALVGTTDVGEVPLFLAFVLALASTRAVLATKAAALPASLGVMNEADAVTGKLARGDTAAARLLVEANAVSQFGGAIFQLGGAGVAIAAAPLLPAEPIVFLGALVYGAGAVFGLATHAVGQPAGERTSLWGELAHALARILAGLREVVRTPKAAASISTYFWIRLLWSFSIVAIGFIARSLLVEDDTQVLLLTGGAGALGAVGGFVSAHRLHTRVPATGYLVLGAAALLGGSVLVLGPFTFRFSIALLTGCLGFGFFVTKIALDTMVQEALGDGFRGRAFSLYDIAYNLAWVVAALVLNLTWSDERQGLVLAGMGGAFLVGIAGISAWFHHAGLLEASPQRAT